MKAKSILVVWSLVAVMMVLAFSGFSPGTKVSFPKFFQRSPETRANMLTMVMQNRLNLDDKQSENAYRVNLKYAQMIQPYLEKGEEVPVLNKELVTLNQKRKDELKSILTEYQLKEADTLRQQWISRLEIILKQMKEDQFSHQ
ncbi:hypothetical protein [Prolixibacter sp. SD074]|uniref:hypothetical protein n=1 Tax=Prolixibacter sp. SD074 TaxID=2652391 RepID=UPI00127DDDE0|nr:hypothetical protein [Prolixibacter sp. SD074]GET29210.1 hypothetical protein SD074_14120 [Prolixibacter sp. SD074]